MGCDIHLMTEYRPGYGPNKDKWVCADCFMPNPEYVEGEAEAERYFVEPIYNDRNYALFGMLANVRNYDFNNPYIDEPRGLPEDATEDVLREAGKWRYDGHSYSYLTLKELLDFREKHPGTEYSGFVSPEDAKALDNGTGQPGMWCQGTSDSTWVWRKWHVPESPLDALIDAIGERISRIFWFDFLPPEERKEKIKGVADAFRIVFWFDN